MKTYQPTYTVEAIQYDGSNSDDIIEFVVGHSIYCVHVRYDDDIVVEENRYGFYALIFVIRPNDFVVATPHGLFCEAKNDFFNNYVDKNDQQSKDKK